MQDFRERSLVMSHFIKSKVRIMAHKMKNKDDFAEVKVALEDAKEEHDIEWRRVKGKTQIDLALCLHLNVVFD